MGMMHLRRGEPRVRPIRGRSQGSPLHDVTRFFTILFFVLTSCSKFSCHPPSEPTTAAPQPSWFDATVPEEVRLKRLLYLLPPDSEMILSFNPDNLFHETALKPLAGFLSSLWSRSSADGKSAFDLQGLTNLSGQKFMAGMTRTPEGLKLIALAAGPYRKDEIRQNLKQTAELSGSRLTEIKKEKISITVLAEDADWGAAFPSDELMFIGNVETISPAAEKYLERAPPTDKDLETLPTFQEINAPLFLHLRPVESPEADIREIEAAIRLENGGNLIVKLVCADEKRAKHLKEYLSASQIMGIQIPKAVSDLTKFFLKAKLEQKGAELLLTWRMTDIPWEALMGIVAQTMKPSEDS